MNYNFNTKHPVAGNKIWSLRFVSSVHTEGTSHSGLTPQKGFYYPLTCTMTTLSGLLNFIHVPLRSLVS